MSKDETRAQGNVLVMYTTNRATITQTHKRVTEENAEKECADPKFLRTIARKFESKGTPFGEIISLFNNTRREIAALGLKLPTGGYLVRASHLERVTQLFDEADDELNRLRGELRRQYDNLVSQSKARLGGAVDAVEFDSAENVAAQFKHELHFTADPTINNVTVDGLTEEVAARTRAIAKKTKESGLLEGHKHLMRELIGFLHGTGDKDVGIIGVLKDAKRIRTGRFNQLAKRLKTARDLNYLDLPELDHLISRLDEVADADLDTVRGDKTARTELQQKSEDIVTTTRRTLETLGL